MADNNTNTDKLMDELLKGNISRAEAEAQLLQLETDPGAAIEAHRIAAVAIQRYSVLQQVSGVHRLYVQNRAAAIEPGHTTAGPAAARGKGLLKMMMRAAAVLVIAAGSLLAWQYSANSNTKLYSELYESYNVIVDRGAGADSALQLVRQYQQKKFSEVIRTYSTLSSRSSRERFLTAMAYCEQNDYAGAVLLLEELLEENRKTGSSLYNDAAEFYLGTAYLKVKKYDQAYTCLSRIYSDNRHTYHEKVSRWLLIRLKWLR